MVTETNTYFIKTTQLVQDAKTVSHFQKALLRLEIIYRSVHPVLKPQNSDERNGIVPNLEWLTKESDWHD